MTGNQYCLWVATAVCADSGVWAAWAQAVLSFVGILYAARVSEREARGVRHRHLAVYQSMLQLAVVEVHNANRLMREARGAHLIDGGSSFGPRMRESFAAIPLHDVPDPQLVSVIVRATNECNVMADVYERIGGADYVVHALDGTSVDGARQILDECVRDSFNIRFREQPLQRLLARTVFAVAAPAWKRASQWQFVRRKLHDPPG